MRRSRRIMVVALLGSLGAAAAPLNPAYTASEFEFYEKLHSDPTASFRQRFPQYAYTVSASQPLYRRQNTIAVDQAKQQVGQIDYVLASVQQDLIVRVAQPSRITGTPPQLASPASTGRVRVPS